MRIHLSRPSALRTRGIGNGFYQFVFPCVARGRMVTMPLLGAIALGSAAACSSTDFQRLGRVNQ